jgi:GntR family transcriptional regulator
VSFPRQTAYAAIAAELRQAILAGEYEPTPDQPDRGRLPGAAELGARYGVSSKTAARAVQDLVAEGLVTARPGMSPAVIPRRQRQNRWPMESRYTRARGAGGVVFGEDMLGRDVVKRTARAGWTAAPARIAALLRAQPGDRVWERVRETIVDGTIAGLGHSYFPQAIAENTPNLQVQGPLPGGLVKVLESAGHRIARTSNEIRARLADEDELRAFGLDPALDPLHGRIVLEVTYATYSTADEPIEAVVTVRPAADTITVNFQTSEISGKSDDE